MQDEKQVRDLIKAIEDDLQQPSQDSDNRRKLLEKLKVLGRNPQLSASIFAKHGLEVLAKCAFEAGSSTDSASEALRCIANALFLSPAARKTALELGLDSKVANHFRHASIDDEFLCSRILFLLTYGTAADFDKLFETNQLDKSIIGALHKHAATFEAQEPSPAREMALAETLKLAFNLSHLYQNLTVRLLPVVGDVVRLLLCHSVDSKNPLQPPISHLLNLLMPFGLEDSQADLFFPSTNPHRVVNRLIEILDTAVRTMSESALDQEAATAITLLRRLYELAPSGSKENMRKQLLPSEEQREQPLGQSEDLPGRLLRLSTATSAANLRDSISNMLFELSDKDPRRFVSNVGYGYAAGFLVNHKMPVGTDDLQGQQRNSRSGGEESTAQPDVDFVTGQYLKNKEKKNEDPPMSEEEKMREAERLFVLFERLKKTGVVDVQNPIEAAMQSGKIEELPDE